MYPSVLKHVTASIPIYSFAHRLPFSISMWKKILPRWFSFKKWQNYRFIFWEVYIWRNHPLTSLQCRSKCSCAPSASSANHPCHGGTSFQVALSCNILWERYTGADSQKRFIIWSWCSGAGGNRAVHSSSIAPRQALGSIASRAVSCARRAEWGLWWHL